MNAKILNEIKEIFKFNLFDFFEFDETFFIRNLCEIISYLFFFYDYSFFSYILDFFCHIILVQNKNILFKNLK
jgi:hypothetical protein